MHVLDMKGEEHDLLREEQEEMYSLSSNLSALSKLNNSMQWQKSLLLWLKESDTNSK